MPAADLNFFRRSFARAGWHGYWKARIQRTLPDTKRQNISYLLGVMYARIGDKDNAFRWLNRAVDQHSIWVTGMVVDPKVDSLHSDPRFQALRRRTNLPK